MVRLEESKLKELRMSIALRSASLAVALGAQFLLVAFVVGA